MPNNRVKEHNKKMKNTVIFIQKNLYVFSFISIILIFVFFYLLHISLSLAAAISAIIISIDEKKVSDLFILLLPTAFDAIGSFCLWIFKVRGNRYEQIRS